MRFLVLELSLESRFYSKREVSGGFSCLWCLSFSSAFLGLYLACIAVEKHVPYQKCLSKLQLLLLLASFLFLLPSLVWQCCFSLFPRQAFPGVLVFNRQLFFIRFQISLLVALALLELFSAISLLFLTCFSRFSGCFLPFLV